MSVISSPQNQLFKNLKSLLTAKGIHQQNLALFAGKIMIADLLHVMPAVAQAWIINSKEDGPQIETSLPIHELAPSLFKQLDLFGTASPLLICKIPEYRANSDLKKLQQGCVLVIPFQNPENVGGILRSAAAFGVKHIVLTAEAAHPFLPKSLRAAGACAFNFHYYRTNSLRSLDLTPIPSLILDAKGEDIAAKPFPPLFALIPGIEGPGVPDELKHLEMRSIPIDPGVESLNANVATSIALYVWRRQFSAVERT